MTQVQSNSTSDTDIHHQIEQTDTNDSESDVQPPDQTSKPAGLPLDQIFEILKNQRRRYVLEYLNEVDEPVSMGELSEKIAARENDKSVQELSSSERKRVYVGLYQCHLPKMDGMDIVSFNKPRGIIELDENAVLFEEYIWNDEPTAPPWYRYYAALSVLSVGTLAAAAVLASVTTLPVFASALVLIVGAFAICSGAHVKQARLKEEDS